MLGRPKAAGPTTGPLSQTTPHPRALPCQPRAQLVDRTPPSSPLCGTVSDLPLLFPTWAHAKHPHFACHPRHEGTDGTLLRSLLCVPFLSPKHPEAFPVGPLHHLSTSWHRSSPE
jgi:hypothetical protein